MKLSMYTPIGRAIVSSNWSRTRCSVCGRQVPIPCNPESWRGEGVWDSFCRDYLVRSDVNANVLADGKLVPLVHDQPGYGYRIGEHGPECGICHPSDDTAGLRNKIAELAAIIPPGVLTWEDVDIGRVLRDSLANN